MKMKYVGLKDFEDAFSSETGVTWGPGVEHEISDPAMVARMLRHPDVWAVAESKAKKASAPAPVPTADTAGEGDGEGDGDQSGEEPVGATYLMQTAEGPLSLDGLDKATLRELAKEAGLKIHHTKAEDFFRAELAKAAPVN